MPRAICQKCGHEVNWSNTRGSRLADLRHGGCGGALSRPPREADVKPRGEQVKCAVCGRRRFSQRGNVYRTTKPHQWHGSGAWVAGQPPVRETQPGDFVCWAHTLIANNDRGTIYGRCAAELAKTGDL